MFINFKNLLIYSICFVEQMCIVSRSLCRKLQLLLVFSIHVVVWRSTVAMVLLLMTSLLFLVFHRVSHPFCCCRPCCETGIPIVLVFMLSFTSSNFLFASDFDCFFPCKTSENPHFFRFEAKWFSLLFRFKTENMQPTLLQHTGCWPPSPCS